MKSFLKKYWLIIVAIAYVILPTDLIPDFILGIGQADDLAIFFGSLLINYFKKRNGKIPDSFNN